MNGNDCKVSSGFTTYRKYKKSPFYSLFFRSTYFRFDITIVWLFHRSTFSRSTFFRKLFYLFDILLFWHFPCRHLVVCFIFPKLFSSTIKMSTPIIIFTQSQTFSSWISFHWSYQILIIIWTTRVCDNSGYCGSWAVNFTVSQCGNVREQSTKV